MMLGVIRSLCVEGTTVLLSAHQLELVERLADRVFLLAQGRRVLAGTVPELIASDHGGYSLQITFACSVAVDACSAWKENPALDGFQFLSDRSIQLTIRDKSTATQWIERASQLGEVTDFRGGSLSLHHIYLRALIVPNRPLAATPAFA